MRSTLIKVNIVVIMRQPLCKVKGSVRTVCPFNKCADKGCRTNLLLSPFAKDEVEGKPYQPPCFPFY